MCGEKIQFALRNPKNVARLATTFLCRKDNNWVENSERILHNSCLMRKQSGFKKLVKWKWYEIRNFINKFGWNSIFKKIFSITSGLNGLLILIGDKVRYKKGSKKLKPKGMVLVKGRNQGFSNPYFLKIWSTKT